MTMQLSNDDTVKERVIYCYDCQKAYRIYKPNGNKCWYCGSENLQATRYTGMTLKKDELEAYIKKQHQKSRNMQPISDAVVINNFKKSPEEAEYYRKRDREIYEANLKEYVRRNTAQPKSVSQKNATMPAGVPYKSSEYYLYNSHKNEGYGCLIVVLCLLCILCGQWYMIFAVLFMYGRFCNQNNKDLNNSPDIQKHREITKDVRENSVYSEEFLEEERKRLGL